ncbi:MAG: hypothetical protein V8R07_09940 [Bacteroides fragilis]|nr:hypothetical protein [Bacteroides fragilis]MCS3117693.1 hypothetical protein [Bacteroides fragilis]MCY1130209.1 hypothetical protein [Bacteroides fragilis]
MSFNGVGIPIAVAVHDQLNFELLEVPLIVTLPPVAATAGLDASIVVDVPAPA